MSDRIALADASFRPWVSSDRIGRLAALLIIGAAAFPDSAAEAQQGAPVEVRHEVFVGSEIERYLRVLQTIGRVELYPWTVRGLSPAEVDRVVPRDSAHPWSGRYDLTRGESDGLELALVRPRTGLIYNSSFAYGSNDGVVWAGRGVTATAQAGFAARYGPVSLVVAPVAFWTQNREFELASNGLEGEGRFRSAIRPNNIDLPQRFGDAAYARIDPGESTLRIDGFGVAAGVSTASQQWGPAQENPLLLGNNAGGFPHAFLGTSEPADLWVGHLHGRLVWGRLDQSAYSPAEGAGRRLAPGLVVAFTPRGLDGLELGVSRFFHLPWPEEGLTVDLLRTPLDGFLKQGDLDADQRLENQLASVFGRWVLPKGGLEVYGEFLREDHSLDLRRLVLDPEDLNAYLLGARRVWTVDDGRIYSLRVEVMNSESSHRERDTRGFQAVPNYTHHQLIQGHTLRGQMLGPVAGPTGAGAIVGLDRYYPGGRWTAQWSRTLWLDRTSGVATMSDSAVDVAHALTLESVAFRNRFDLTAGVTGVYELNRNLGTDAFNLRASIGFRSAF